MELQGQNGHADTPFLDFVLDVPLNVMIADLLLLSVALAIFGLYYGVGNQKGTPPKGDWDSTPLEYTYSAG